MRSTIWEKEITLTARYFHKFIKSPKHGINVRPNFDVQVFTRDIGKVWYN